MAAAGLSPVCYNHPEKRADFKCFDCKYEGIIYLCPQCNIQVHSLDVFKAHRFEQIEVKGRERRLSQDVQDIEKLIEVETELLQCVMTRLKYTEQEEKETLSQLVQIQTATKKRIAEIKGCEATIEKAFQYLAKVSNMLTQCSTPVEGSSSEVDPAAQDAEATVEQPDSSVSDSFQLLPLAPAEEIPHGSEDHECVPEEPIVLLSKELEGKEVFAVRIVGSLDRNGSFWITKIGEPAMEKQKEIQMAIKNHFRKNGFGNPIVPEAGLFCAALHRQCKEFCRARIENVTSSGMSKIRFLDYGTVEDFAPSGLCELPSELDDTCIPFQAFKCCLLPDLGTQLPYEAKWCFKDLTFNKELMAAVEGQLTDENGLVTYHVLLSTCGDDPVCINTKVAKRVDEQKLALVDRPVQPKEEKGNAEEAVVEKDTSEPQNLDIGAASNVTQETDSKSNVAGETTVVKTDTEGSVPNETVIGDDKISVVAEKTDSATEDRPALRAEAAVFVPLSPEKDRTSVKVPVQAAVKQNRIPGILHFPDSLASAMPASEHQAKDVPVYDHQVHQMPESEDQVKNLPASEHQFKNVPASERQIKNLMPSECQANEMPTPEHTVKKVLASEHQVNKVSTSEHLDNKVPTCTSEHDVNRVLPIEHYNNKVPDNNLPVGCVDFAMYNHILTKCSLNMICMEDLPHARFMMIRSDVRRIIEAMKFNVWCSTVPTNRRLNNVFNSVTNRDGRSPVFLLFAGVRNFNFCGMAEMLSSVDPTQSCPMLNKSFKFGGRMVGRCEIKWIYATNLYFGDVITPDCGFSARYLNDAGDGFEIANELGKDIVNAYDNIGYFQSILEKAMKTHQSHLFNHKEKQLSSDAEPIWWKGTKEELSDGSPTSQEDWDQEIEDSLKSAKSSEVDKDKTDLSSEVKIDGCETLSADDTPVDGDGPSHSLDSGKGVELLESEKEVVIEEADSLRPDATVQEPRQSNDPKEVIIDQEEAISLDNSPAVNIKTQNMAASNDQISQPLETEESIPLEKKDSVNDIIVPSGSSDWENSTSSKTSLEEVAALPTDGSDWESRTPSKTSLKEDTVATPGAASDWENSSPSKTSLVEDTVATPSAASDWENSSPSKTSLVEDTVATPSAANDWENSSPSKTSLDVEAAVEFDRSNLEMSSKISLEEDTAALPSVSGDLETGMPSKTSLIEETGVEPTPSKTSLDEETTSQTTGGSDWETGTPSKTSLVEETAVEPTGGSDWETGTPSKTSLDEETSAQPTCLSDGNTGTSVETSVREETAVEPTDRSDWKTGMPSKTSLDTETSTEPTGSSGGDTGTSLEQEMAVQPTGSNDLETATPSSLIQTNLVANGSLEDLDAITGQVNSDTGIGLDTASKCLQSPQVLSQESSEELLLSDYLPLEIGKEHWIIVQENLSSSGTFWAQVVRSNKEEDSFVDAMIRMGAHIEAKNKTLDPSEIFIYKQCAVKGRDGYWYRALVEKSLDKGKICIRLLDIGDTREVHQADLRVLDDEFYTSPPAQAFECCLSYSNPNSKKEKNRISKLVRRNKKIRVLVKSYSADTVEVQVIS